MGAKQLVRSKKLARIPEDVHMHILTFLADKVPQKFQRLINLCPIPFHSMAWATDRAVVTDQNSRVRWFDPRLMCVKHQSIPRSAQHSYPKVALTYDGTALALSSATVSVYTVDSSTETVTLQEDIAMQRSVYSIRFVDNDNLIIKDTLASHRYSIEAESLTELKQQAASCTSAKSRDGKISASLKKNQENVIVVQKGQETFELEHTTKVSYLRLSPQGTYLLTMPDLAKKITLGQESPTSTGYTIAVWDLATKKCIYTFTSADLPRLEETYPDCSQYYFCETSTDMSSGEIEHNMTWSPDEEYLAIRSSNNITVHRIHAHKLHFNPQHLDVVEALESRIKDNSKHGSMRIDDEVCKQLADLDPFSCACLVYNLKLNTPYWDQQAHGNIHLLLEKIDGMRQNKSQEHKDRKDNKEQKKQS